MKKTLLIIFLFASIQLSIAQNTTVSGTVSDNESNSIQHSANSGQLYAVDYRLTANVGVTFDQLLR